MIPLTPSSNQSRIALWIQKKQIQSAQKKIDQFSDFFEPMRYTGSTKNLTKVFDEPIVMHYVSEESTQKPFSVGQVKELAKILVQQKRWGMRCNMYFTIDNVRSESKKSTKGNFLSTHWYADIYAYWKPKL